MFGYSSQQKQICLSIVKPLYYYISVQLSVYIPTIAFFTSSHELIIAQGWYMSISSSLIYMLRTYTSSTQTYWPYCVPMITQYIIITCTSHTV